MEKLTQQSLVVAGIVSIFSCLVYNFLENMGPLTGMGFVTAFAIIGSVGLKAEDLAADAKTEVKVRILGPNQIEVIVDQAAEKNAAKIKHGKPHGVHYVQVALYSTEIGEEIYNEKSTQLRKKIDIPAQYHGKQVGIKAAFLVHVEDKPNFGDGAIFSMPLTTQDLIEAFEHQHKIDREARSKAVEIHKQEIAQVEEELKSKQ
jgi:hypothetical protein